MCQTTLQLRLECVSPDYQSICQSPVKTTKLEKREKINDNGGFATGAKLSKKRYTVYQKLNFGIQRYKSNNLQPKSRT